MEEDEELARYENKDDSEIDADYESEDAQEDEGDPDEMELGVEFEDVEERTKYKRGKSRSRGALQAAVTPSIIPARGRRGGKRGRPSTRGRGGRGRARARRSGGDGRERACRW